MIAGYLRFRKALSWIGPAVEGFEVKVVPACEVLLGNPSVREKIRQGQEEDLPAIVGKNEEGMCGFTHALAELVKKEWVTVPTAMEYAPNRDSLSSILKGVEVKAASMVNRVRTGGH